MNETGRLSVSVVFSFVAHAAVAFLFPSARETPPRLRARRGPVSIVVRRRPSRTSRGPTSRAPSRHVRQAFEKKAPRFAEPSRAAAPPEAAAQPVLKESQEKLSPLSLEPARPELSEEAPPVREDAGVTNARLLGDARPGYPSCCQSGSCNGGKGREAVVRVEVEVLPDGRAGRITLLRQSGCRIMDRSVERFFRRARFAPATRAGRPVSLIRIFRVRFKLEDR